MNNTRVSVIPDRLFNKLWQDVKNYNDCREYINNYSRSTSENKIDFSRYNLHYEEFTNILKEIYNAYNLTFRNILDKAGVKKSEIANTFCIPIRTIEDWYTGKNMCPAYIRLTLIRHYYLINLGKYVYLDSEQKRKLNKPKVYNVKEKESGTVLDDDMHSKVINSFYSQVSIKKGSGEKINYAEEFKHLDEIINRRKIK